MATQDVSAARTVRVKLGIAFGLDTFGRLDTTDFVTSFITSFVISDSGADLEGFAGAGAGAGVDLTNATLDFTVGVSVPSVAAEACGIGAAGTSVAAAWPRRRIVQNVTASRTTISGMASLAQRTLLVWAALGLTSCCDLSSKFWVEGSGADKFKNEGG
jgi:hypothetical protein